MGPSIMKLKCTLHRMNMGDNMNIIDDVNTFLFKIWLDGWEELFEENIELTTMSLSLQSMRCMSEWRGSSMIMDDYIYLNGVLAEGKFMTN